MLAVKTMGKVVRLLFSLGEGELAWNKEQEAISSTVKPTTSGAFFSIPVAIQLKE